MTTRNLDKLFSPKSIALIGASDKSNSIGRTVAENLLHGGFKGSVWFVNPKHPKILDRPCYADIKNLPEVPDLAVIATPPQSIPGLISDLGKKGTRIAVVITAGIREQNLQQVF